MNNGLLNLTMRSLGGYLYLQRRLSILRDERRGILDACLIMNVSFLAGGFFLQNHRLFLSRPILVMTRGQLGLCPIGRLRQQALQRDSPSLLKGSCLSSSVLLEIWLSLTSRLQVGRALWIIGVVSIGINALLIPVKVPALRQMEQAGVCKWV